MARVNALTMQRRTMNPAQCMQYNVQLAKRCALFYVSSIDGFHKRTVPDLEWTSLKLSIDEVRELFGVWNTAWPTTFALRNLAESLEQRGGRPALSTLDAEMLRGMAELSRLAAKIADPRDAVKRIRVHHKALLDTLGNYAENGPTWETFRGNRERDMNVLASKLR